MMERWNGWYACSALALGLVANACSSGDDDASAQQCSTPPCAGGAAAPSAMMSPATGQPLGGTTATAGTTPMGGMTAPPPGGMGAASGTGMSGSGGTSAGSGGSAMAGGMGAAPDASAGMDSGTMTSSAQSLPPVSDYLEDGPFATKTEANTGPSGNYTIFRPDPLGENGFKHSPLVFGPGILTSASMYSNLLTHLASHGIVSICVNSLSGGPNDPGNLSAMKDGLDWLIAQNDEAGPYQDKLAVDRAIAMGYSIGATASTQLSSHPAIFTTVSIHGHNTKGDPHGPIWLLTGTNDVIDDNRATLSTLEEAPAIMTALPIGHLDVLTELAMSAQISASTRYIAPITAWLRYWINGDEDAKRFFWGDGCEICKTPWITPETNDAWKAQTL